MADAIEQTRRYWRRIVLFLALLAVALCIRAWTAAVIAGLGLLAVLQHPIWRERWPRVHSLAVGLLIVSELSFLAFLVGYVAVGGYFAAAVGVVVAASLAILAWLGLRSAKRRSEQKGS
jgi:hypothetical protein